MRTQKRIVSLLLTACLLLSLCAALPLVATAEVVSTSGWDGTTATQPEGSGTKDDPYLVSSAENLLWIQKQIPRADGVNDETAAASGGYKQAFAGVYFLQTQDIDLNGKSFASIGYYYANANRMGAFGGTYNGQGFAIRNGKIISQNNGHLLNVNWGHGLFGMIYGATIQNIVLDNVQVEGHGIVGAIVGRAVSNADNQVAAETFNTVENCVVNANCTVTAYYPSSVTAQSSDYDQASRAGGIVGMAYGTTVRYCVNRAAVNVPGNWNMTGGIVGSVGFNTTVEFCINTGTITYDLASIKNTSENAVGGIAGFVTPYTSGIVDKSLVGNVIIRNCYNSGAFQVNAGANEPGRPIYWGGILGGANSMHKATNQIENCYNLYELRQGTSVSSTGNYRLGGLVGSYWIENNAAVGALKVLNSFSVDVDEKTYSGSNQCRYYSDRKNDDGEICVEESTSGQKTAEELAPLTAAIDEAITAFNATATAKKVGDLAVQRTTLGTETYSLRFSAQIVGSEYEQAGFRVYASYKDGDTVKVSKVNTVALYSYYTSLNQTVDGETTQVKPGEGKYFVAFVVENVPVEYGEITFTLTPYVVDADGTSYGNTVSVTFDTTGTIVE